MKKILFIFSTLLLFCSCDIESSKNGDLDGFWHLERVDTISTSFNHHENRLDLSDPHLRDREKGDPAISSSTMYLIRPYGINEEEEYFQVVTLNGDDMVLRNQDLQLWFRKF